MFRELLLDENIEIYKDYYERSSFKTIYHHPMYLQAEEKAEEYPTYLYIYEQDGLFVILPSVKRKINDIDIFADEKETYFDLITPHEYSGVISNVYDINLFQVFYSQLEEFCTNHNIIFQFIRFNPYSYEYKGAAGFDIVLADQQNWVDCEDDILSHFQKRKARYVKAAMKNGIECREFEKNVENIQIFYQYYEKAMNRLAAKRFLYFNLEYFVDLCVSEFTKLFFVIDSNTQKLLSGLIVLCDADHKKIYHHLSFRNEEIGNIHSMEYMIYATAQWAKTNGYISMHLGGGSSSLHGFKDGCTDKRVEYYVGTKIHNIPKYNKLADKFCNEYPQQRKSTYLPIYRSKE